MFRKIFASALVLAATLVIVPSVLAMQGASATRAPFTHGTVVSGGWASPQPVNAGRLRIGVPVSRSLTVENQGSLAATYRLNARITGDHAFADQLLVIVTRSEDGATIFSGPATHLQAVDLGRFTARQQETLHLKVTLASTGSDAGDNILQGRAAGVAFSWTATQA
ncbi:MAG: hypothetical protein QOK34_1041 [Gaiellaceae bacterium]|nr:hypothetical protein [Gaiellaceae bacterium]